MPLQSLSVAVAAICFYSIDQWLRAPYLIFFMTAVAFSTLFGLGPGFAALFLATLVSAYFFIPPLRMLSVNRTTWIAAGSYGFVLFLTRFGEQYVRRKLAQSFLFQDFAAKQNEETNTARDLVGRLDGHVKGELYGWAIDKNQMSIPPKITFYVDERPGRRSSCRPLPPGCEGAQFLFRFERVLSAFISCPG